MWEGLWERRLELGANTYRVLVHPTSTTNPILGVLGRCSRRLAHVELAGHHVGDEACAGQADQDGRPSGAALPAIDLSVIRGVGSSMVVPGSVGSYLPVIAGAKLRENATTILPRGRALQGVGLSSMRFHPTGGGPEDDKDGQVSINYAFKSHLLGFPLSDNTGNGDFQLLAPSSVGHSPTNSMLTGRLDPLGQLARLCVPVE